MKRCPICGVKSENMDLHNKNCAEGGYDSKSSDERSIPAPGGTKVLNGQVESPRASNLPPWVGTDTESNNAAPESPATVRPGANEVRGATPHSRPLVSSSPVSAPSSPSSSEQQPLSKDEQDIMRKALRRSVKIVQSGVLRELLLCRDWFEGNHEGALDEIEHRVRHMIAAPSSPSEQRNTPGEVKAALDMAAETMGAYAGSAEKEELERHAYQAMQILGAAITGEDHGCHVGNLAEMAQEVASKLKATQQALASMTAARDYCLRTMGEAIEENTKLRRELAEVKAELLAWQDTHSRLAVSARPTISGIPIVKMLRDQRDKLADALWQILWIKDCGVDGKDENGVFRNFPETERDAMYNIAKDALKDVPSYVQQLRNIAAGIGMDYDELVRRLASGNEREGSDKRS